ncbi:MAG: hypothetical protein IJX46_06525 [Clostridia bacterium]|nr:hypothetical protein [Clostridia bacterium]
MRSKAAKITLWVLLGCTVALLLCMTGVFIVDAMGGTGTTHHWAMPLFSTIFFVFLFLLIFVYFVTEPSFKRNPEDEPELYTVDRDSYVKKAKQPRPVADMTAKKEEPETEPAETIEKSDENASEGEAESDEPDPAPAEPEEEVEDELDDEADEDEDDDEDDDEEKVDDLPDAVLLGAVAATDGDENTVYIRYRRSFMSRIIQASDDAKGYYKDIKNRFLSYKGVKARTSWGFESYNCGRNKLAKVNVRGKTLVVYFAIDPKELDAKYRVKDMSEKSRYAAVPALLKVKSARAAKYALEIIDLMMAKNETPALPTPCNEDYDLAYRDTSALIDEGLIKIVYNSNIVPDENTKIEEANIADLIKNK